MSSVIYYFLIKKFLFAKIKTKVKKSENFLVDKKKNNKMCLIITKLFLFSVVIYSIINISNAERTDIELDAKASM
jgi:hypothetical protein